MIVAAPLSGWCALLDDSPDPVFREQTLGNGVSIDPTDNVVTAPFDAEITNIPESKHAIGLRAKNGAELLIHIGIDTVQLCGEGFTAHVTLGEQVQKGQSLLSFDMDIVLERALSLRTPVLLLESEDYQIIELNNLGAIKAGDPLFEITARKPTSPSIEQHLANSDATYVKTIKVGLSHGIHARPAALLVSSIKNFSATITCGTDSNTFVNARSATALMAMGVQYGTDVTVKAKGADAEQAAKTFIAHLEPCEESTVLSKTKTVLGDGAIIRAQPAGPGLAIGKSLQLTSWKEKVASSQSSPDIELNRLENAMEVVRDYLTKLASSKEGLAKEIAEAHIVLLDDPTILDSAKFNIFEGSCAAIAWQRSVADVTESLANLDNKRLRERVDDLEDISLRVQRALGGHSPGDTLTLTQDTVIIAETLLPSQLLELEQAHLIAICTAAGGTTSHVAILAAAMGIPMLVAAGNEVLDIENDNLLVVDADYGELHVRPDQQAILLFQERVRENEQLDHDEREHRNRVCITQDGERVIINANIASVKDAVTAAQRGADGCGLLRTEFVFMDRTTPPTVNEQQLIYQQISDELGDRPIVIRTLDAGGDKPIAYIDHAPEENPALGIRGIRLSLINKDLLEKQIAALLQLRCSREMRLMIPMVTSPDEVHQVRGLINRLCDAKNVEHVPQLGVMIETPAAALIADKLARIVDFFSIGTNDLTQYTLAMDRGEPKLAASFDTLHPAVLRLIARTVEAANAAHIPVAVCGGAAGDLLASPILIGLGIRELSMIPNAITRQKSHIRTLNLSHCEKLAQRAMSMNSASDVRAMMREIMTANIGK